MSGEESTTSRKSHKRKASRAASPPGEPIAAEGSQQEPMRTRGYKHPTLSRGKLLLLIVKPLVFFVLNLLILFFVTDLSHLDSQPDTPMSIESANSDASKLRVKIKVIRVLIVFSSALDTG